jgi:hypothetical protein
MVTGAASQISSDEQNTRHNSLSEGMGLLICITDLWF